MAPNSFFLQHLLSFCCFGFPCSILNVLTRVLPFLHSHGVSSCLKEQKLSCPIILFVAALSMKFEIASVIWFFPLGIWQLKINVERAPKEVFLGGMRDDRTRYWCSLTMQSYVRSWKIEAIPPKSACLTLMLLYSQKWVARSGSITPLFANS